jgi:hypothetical protein
VQAIHLGVDLDLRPWRHKPNRCELALLLRQSAKGLSNEDILEHAKRTLDSMVVVGTVERLAESIVLIRRHFGLPVPEVIPRKNVAANRQPHLRYLDTMTFPNWMLDRIESLIEYDRSVYAYGCRLLDEKLAAHGE